MKVRRVVLLVLDGFGVGAMPDAPPSDTDSHTLRHVIEGAGGLEVPNMARLGLGRLGGMNGLVRTDGSAQPTGAHGIAGLGYPGADTYLGHQELMGSPAADFRLHMLADYRDQVIARLRAEGHAVRDGQPGSSLLLVDERAVVADNIEAAPGLNINVTGSMDEISFQELLAIGRAIREEVALPRVIVVGGRGFTTQDIIGAVIERAAGHVGVDTPGLGTYDENYVVRHLGFADGTSNSLPEVVLAAGRDVLLLGKAADVVESPAAERSNDVATDAVLSKAAERLTSAFEGLIVANVQETDLAGHEQDALRYRRVLERVDGWIPRIEERLGEDGVLFIGADHGNDPALGTSRHTREFVPILVAGEHVSAVDLGVRSSLSDIAATIAELLGVALPESGASFAASLQMLEREVPDASALPSMMS